MRGHNIRFHLEIRISLNYPQYPFLSEALISSLTGWLHNRIMTPNVQEYLSLKGVTFKKRVTHSMLFRFLISVINLLVTVMEMVQYIRIQ